MTMQQAAPDANFRQVRVHVSLAFTVDPAFATDIPALRRHAEAVLDGKAEPNDELLAVLGLKRVPRT